MPTSALEIRKGWHLLFYSLELNGSTKSCRAKPSTAPATQEDGSSSSPVLGRIFPKSTLLLQSNLVKLLSILKKVSCCQEKKGNCPSWREASQEGYFTVHWEACLLDSSQNKLQSQPQSMRYPIVQLSQWHREEMMQRALFIKIKTVRIILVFQEMFCQMLTGWGASQTQTNAGNSIR